MGHALGRGVDQWEMQRLVDTLGWLVLRKVQVGRPTVFYSARCERIGVKATRDT